MRKLAKATAPLTVIALCGMTIISVSIASSSANKQPPCSPEITATSPAMNEIGAPDSSVISMTFGSEMNPTSYNDTTFVVTGSLSGPQSGTIWGDANTLNMTQSHSFAAGEVVTVTATEGILCADGGYLEHGYTWQFTTAVDPASPGEFLYDSGYSTGDTPGIVTAADLNGDGYMDLVTGNYGSENVSVLLNKGDGSFAANVDYYNGWTHDVIVATDLDGDGDLDLAIAAHNFGGMFSWGIVYLLMNDGPGTFELSRPSVSIGRWALSVVAADLDGDGDMDLAATNGELENISVALNYGDATFAPVKEYPTANYPVSVTAADLDGDGDMDLIAATEHYFDGISVLLNYGDATFAPCINYSTGEFPRCVVAADLDDDGDIDLATANYDSDNVSILLNYGDGTFAPKVDYAAWRRPFSIVAADLDGDGDLDLTTGNSSGRDVSILWNSGEGVFATILDLSSDDGSGSVVAADFDGDGNMDLATANSASNSVSVLLNKPCCTGETMGNVDCTGIIDIGDVTETIQKLFITLDSFCCPREADIDQSGIIDIGDLTMLISSLFITLNPLPACP